MPIEFKGIAKPFNNSQDELNTKSWVAWRRLILYDMPKNIEIPEWFFVVACSRQYLSDNPTAFSNDTRTAILQQETFDERALEEYAREHFTQLSFTDWDDFYTKMSQNFIHEDE